MTDVTITNTEWVNINTLSGISAGTNLRVQNKGNYGVILQVTDTQPNSESTGGAYITSANDPTPYVDFYGETESIYARVFYESASTRHCSLYLSEV